jgi:hypothetical protein
MGHTSVQRWNIVPGDVYHESQRAAVAASEEEEEEEEGDDDEGEEEGDSGDKSGPTCWKSVAQKVRPSAFSAVIGRKNGGSGWTTVSLVGATVYCKAACTRMQDAEGR